MLILALQLLAVSSCGDLCSPEAVDLYARLKALAASNRYQSERAAFLVRTDAGLRAVMWQAGELTEAVYRGPVPKRCLAVIHTHPAIAPQPSRQDIAEARRLRMPIVVVTSGSVIAALPDGTIRPLARF